MAENAPDRYVACTMLPEERELFERHMLMCGDCQAAVESAVLLIEALAIDRLKT